MDPEILISGFYFFQNLVTPAAV